MQLTTPVLVSALTLAVAAEQPTSFPTTIDLNDQVHRQVVVDREAGQYLGHPTTCLLEDGRTILCVYPKGHGRGAIVYKRSTDGGLTWSARLPTPASWATSLEVPTLHRVIDPEGTKRIIMWSGLYPARLAVTEDDGASWSNLRDRIPGVPEGIWVSRVEASHHDLETCYVTFDGHRSDVFRPFVFRTRDMGRTWENITSDLPDGHCTYVIREDSQNPDLKTQSP